MTTVATALGRRTAIDRAAVRAWAPAVTLAVITAALFALTWATWGDIGSDTGYDVIAGVRLSQGDMPYLDFTYFYGPLSPAVLALAAIVGGDGVAPPIVVGLLVTGAIVAATYLLARSVTSGLGGLLAGAITAGIAVAPTNFSFVAPHSYSETLGITALLGMLLLLHRRSIGGHDRIAVAAGICLGLIMLTRPELAVAAGAAAIAWLLPTPGAGRTRTGEVLRLGAPAVILAALVYLPLVAVVGFDRLVFSNIYPVDTLGAGGDTVIGLSAPFTLHSAMELAARTALYGAGVGILVLLARGVDSRRWRIPATLAMVGAGACLAIALVVRTDTMQWAMMFPWAWVPAGAVFAVIVMGRRCRGAARPEDRTMLAVAVALAIIAGKTYAAFTPIADVAQSAAYAVPLAAVLLARLHLVELGTSVSVRRLGALWLAFLALAGAWITVHTANAETVSVSGPGGSMRSAPPAADAYQQAVGWITRTTRPGDPVLLAPQLTSLYTISDRRDPVSVISLLPGALPTAESERQELTRLQDSDLRLAIIDQQQFGEYGHTSFGGSFDRQLDQWIHSTFDHAATIVAPGPGGRRLEVWIRRRG
jgi:hypothetical protein